MKHNKKAVLITLIILFVGFFFFPNKVFAVTVKAELSNPFKSNKTYYTRGWDTSLIQKKYKYPAHNYRETSNLEKFTTTINNENASLFCIEPGASFSSKVKYSATEVTNKSSQKTLPGKIYNAKWAWSATKQKMLQKVMSCYVGSDDGIVSEQALVWEIVTGERTSINASNIFKGNYAPNNKISKSLYDLIKSDSGMYKEYKNTLICAARFDSTATPSWASTTKALSLSSVASESQSKAEFKSTYKVDSGNAQKDLFKYYSCKIGNSAAKKCTDGLTASGVTLKCSNNSCTISTQKEIAKSSPVKITFEYYYLPNGKTLKYRKTLEEKNITEWAIFYEYGSSHDKQSLMIGAIRKTFTLNVYTGSAPKYALKVQKVDEDGKTVITTGTAKFAVYDDSKLKNKVCEITTSKGQGECKGLKRTGKYYVVELQAPTGHIKKSGYTTVNVTSADTEANIAKIKYTSIKNTDRHLIMDKRTLDPETGKVISLTGDSCTVKTCDNGIDNGPVFEIKSGNKYVCVTEISNGKYKYKSMNENCPSGTTKDIKTCNGKFDIIEIPTGTFVVTETKTVCGSTLPKNPSQTITIKETDTKKTVTMENGVSGVVFNKLNENGSLINGGKFALQVKQNGIYIDVPLKHQAGSIYVYDSSLTATSDNVILETTDGIINVKGLPAGDYRFVEKEAPTGYDAIKDKDSTATFTISDASNSDIQVNLTNKKAKLEGSSDSAELIVTIITGRKVINYVLVIGGLAVLLVALIILRKKFKK